MSKKTQLAKTETTSLGVVDNDPLEGLFDGDVTGLEEADISDLRIPLFYWNAKAVDPETGRSVPPDTFVNAVTEETVDQIDCVLVYMSKQNGYQKFDEAESRNKTICSSKDQKLGVMQDGTQRACDGCPEAKWRTVDGKRTRNCSEVHVVYGVDKETREPFVIRFRRSSMRPWKKYLERYFLWKRTVKGKRMHIPLFAYETKLALRMDSSGKYSLPVITKGPMLDSASMQTAASEVALIKELILAQSDSFAEADGSNHASDHDNTIDVTAASAGGRDEFADDDGTPSQAAVNF